MTKRKHIANLPKTVEKALDILQVFVDSGRLLGITELSHIVGLDKSTTYRITQVFKKRGYVNQDDQTNKYQVGYKMLGIAGSLLNQIKVRQAAKRHLEELAKVSSQTVLLAIPANDEVVYVDHVDGVDIFQIRLHVGDRAPLYCTAAGKCILAFLKEDELEYILDNIDLKAFTPNTITSVKKLKANLKTVRGTGYSFCDGEYDRDIRAIGAPIIGMDMKPIGAVVLAMPSIRLKMRDVPYYGKMVGKVGAEISQNMGGEIAVVEDETR